MGTKQPAPPSGYLSGLASAALFGISAPLAKLLLGSLDPLLLAGLLYTGGGLALTLGSALRPRAASREAPLGRADFWPMLVVVLCGGVVGPLAMLWGLRRVSALSASLLLNLEGPFTMLLAVTFFGEHLGRRQALAAGAILLGAAALGANAGTGLDGDLLGVAALGLACLSWGLDNNVTQRLSLRDPLRVVRAKALGAGLLMLLASYSRGAAMPGVRTLCAALALGAASYGLSILLDAYALRLLGAAREAAVFATAPFMGAVASVVILGDRLRALDVAGAGVMIVGVLGLVRERHGHPHTHAPITHEHLHVHDAHHRHGHAGDVSEPHSHVHTHAPLTHDHPHVSDLHHRHRHGTAAGTGQAAGHDGVPQDRPPLHPG